MEDIPATLGVEMPIEIHSQVEVFNQEEFHAMARHVLRMAFDLHNEFGRLLDEELYKRELAARCHEFGIQPVEREVGITLTHDGFRKEYFMDLLLANGLMVEAKASEGLSVAHHGQALNYLLLAGMQHGLLLKFRAPRVEHRFVSSRLTPALRRQIMVDTGRWQSDSPKAAWLQSRMLRLLEDWGCFLEVNLYRDAIIHFLGGHDQACKQVAILSRIKTLGYQDVTLLHSEAALAITAVGDHRQAQESHLVRFLAHTKLSHLHWINLDHGRVTFTTLSNNAVLS